LTVSPYASADARERVRAVQRMTNAERIAAGMRPKGPAPSPAERLADYRRLTNVERVARGLKPVGRSLAPWPVITLPVARGSALPKAAPAVSFALTAQAQFREDVYGMLNKWAALFEADKRALLNVNGGRGA
jgi:hypothetical protein